jgi:hypothetical protein
MLASVGVAARDPFPSGGILTRPFVTHIFNLTVVIQVHTVGNTRLPSPGAWPCPRGRFSISSSCDGERSRAGSAYAVTVKTDSGKSYSRHHARIGCVDKKWLSTGGIADNACLSEREHVEHPSFLCHGLPVPKTVCPHKAKTGSGSACHAYPLGTHGTPACRHGWCGMFRYTATMRRG